jgi:hypothetical protein
MPESTPVTTGERTVIVQRHSALTYISLGFNALILLLILIGIVAHHDKKPEGRGDGGPMDHHEWADRDRSGGDRGSFNHGGFGGMRHGWHHEGFGGSGGGDACQMGGPGGERGGFGREEDHHGWGGEHPGFGMDGKRGGEDEHPGFGGPGMGGGFGGDHSMSKTPPSAEEMTDRMMLMLTPKLSLTDAESAQIRPIITNDIQQFQKDMEAQRQAHQKMIEDGKTKVRAVLTPDQQKQFDAMTAGMGGMPATPAAGK